MNDFDIKLELENNILNISNLPNSANSDHQISNYCTRIHNYPLKSIDEVILNLQNTTFYDLKTLAFLDSVIRYFISKKLKIKTANITTECQSNMIKNGIICDKNGYLTLVKEERGHTPFFITIADAAIKLFKDAINLFYFTGDLFFIICKSIKHPKKVKWKETFFYMDRAGTDAVPIVLLLCFLLGAILAFQGIVQMGKFGLQIYTANLVGLSIVKELGVLMVAMICVGRAGSAFAAEISTMKVNEEIDAMKTMGLDTSAFLVLPKIIALICVMPLLTIIGNVAGIIGGMVVGCLTSDVTLSEYYIRTISYLKCSDIIESVVKSIIYAILISGISCLRGIEAERDAKGVGHAATSAVVSSIFLIVIADAIITVILNT